MVLLLLFFNIIKGYQKKLQPVSTHAEYTSKCPYDRHFDQENTIFLLRDLLIQ